MLRSVLNWLHEIGIHPNELFLAKQDTATCRGLQSEGEAKKQQSGMSRETTRQAEERHWEGFEAAREACTKWNILLFTVNCPNALGVAGYFL